MPMPLAIAQVSARRSGTSGSLGSGGVSPVASSQTALTAFAASTVVRAPTAPAYRFQSNFWDVFTMSILPTMDSFGQ